MKNIISISFLLLLVNNAIGQTDIYISGGVGIGNHCSKRDPIVTPFKLSAIPSYSIGLKAKLERFNKFKPVIGLNYLRTGSDYRNTFSTSPIYFRYHYLNLPIGLDMDICGGLGAGAFISVSIPFAHEGPRLQEPTRPGTDLGFSPSVYYRFKKCELNATYHFGLSDAARIGYLGDTDYRFFNRVFLMKFGYRIHSLSTK